LLMIRAAQTLVDRSRDDLTVRAVSEEGNA
jgi:hypothetical protein